MLPDETVSLVLGYMSMLSWLGAQFPQIIVNWRRKSVDGLALPFLANWLLGDTTNLIGCLLTNQLPFQTYLATYFVFVDICLVTQYLHYDARRHAKSLSILTSPSALHSRSSLLLPPTSPTISRSPETYKSPQIHGYRRSRSFSVGPQLRAAVANISLATSELDSRYHDGEYPHGRWRRHGASDLEGLPESVVQERRHMLSSETDAESESAPSIMFDSFHSEGGGRGRGRRERHVSWARGERETSARGDEPLTEREENRIARGRQLTRNELYESPVEEQPSRSLPRPAADEDVQTRSRRTSAVSASASRRSASIVFLGVFALFGFYSRGGYQGGANSEGSGSDVPSSSAVLIPEADASPLQYTSYIPLSPTSPSSQDYQVSVSFVSDDTQKVIGRISAWTCTTLYITSRLPQIWKNFVRKSVEGLSMYLFIFAFLGNSFYVLSILTSPKMDQAPPLAKQFLRDSIPYLLGSGGTLLFDVTIVLQSFVYTPSRRLSRAKHRRRSLVASGGEEERALLRTQEQPS